MIVNCNSVKTIREKILTADVFRVVDIFSKIGEIVSVVQNPQLTRVSGYQVICRSAADVSSKLLESISFVAVPVLGHI